MREDQDRRAHVVIVGSTTAAMAAAVVPVPVADVVAITSVQVAMLGALTAIYGLKLDGRVLLSLVMVHGGAQAGMWFGSLLKTVPFVGAVAGGAIEMSIAGTFTAAMGLGMKNLLEHGEPIDPQRFREAADQAREEAGRIVAEQRDAARAKAERDEAVRQRVGLTASATGPGAVEVRFDLGDAAGRSVLRVMDEHGEELCSASVVAGDSPYVFRSSAFRPGATVVVVLDHEGTLAAATVRP